MQKLYYVKHNTITKLLIFFETDERNEKYFCSKVKMSPPSSRTVDYERKTN